MSNPIISGQSLIDLLRINLGGLSNAWTVDQLLAFLNNGKDEVWSIVKSMEFDYFTDATQDTDSTQDDFLVDLNPTTREYALPKNLREIRFVEALTVGFQTRRYVYRDISHVDFRNARLESDSLGSNSGLQEFSSKIFYTVFGNQLIFADYPDSNIQLKIWYIAAIDDIGVGDVPAILFPFSRKIVDYAAKKASLSAQNMEMLAGWKDDWAESVRTIALSVGPRSQSDAQFVEDFTGF